MLIYKNQNILDFIRKIWIWQSTSFNDANTCFSVQLGSFLGSISIKALLKLYDFFTSIQDFTIMVSSFNILKNAFNIQANIAKVPLDPLNIYKIYRCLTWQTFPENTYEKLNRLRRQHDNWKTTANFAVACHVEKLLSLFIAICQKLLNTCFRLITLLLLSLTSLLWFDTTLSFWVFALLPFAKI